MKGEEVYAAPMSYSQLLWMPMESTFLWASGDEPRQLSRNIHDTIDRKGNVVGSCLPRLRDFGHTVLSIWSRRHFGGISVFEISWTPLQWGNRFPIKRLENNCRLTTMCFRWCMAWLTMKGMIAYFKAVLCWAMVLCSFCIYTELHCFYITLGLHTPSWHI